MAYVRTSSEVVAAEYLAAIARNESPTAAVAERCGLTYNAARDKIHRARVKGVLPATTQGKRRTQCGVANPKLLAVAQAIGVAPDLLFEAVIEHADGDLRLRKGAAAVSELDTRAGSRADGAVQA